MKKIYVQKEVIAWEEYTYEVSDNFEDYELLLNNNFEWEDWEYLSESSQDTGNYKIFDENYNELKL